MLVSPCAYQGGKQRLAKNIIEAIRPDGVFYDLCCGSGAVSVELVNQGHDPSKITMLDKSPWGLFWQEIGAGTFDVSKFYSWCQKVPPKAEVKDWMVELGKQPADVDTVYVFLLLQSGSFGSKAIWIENNKWRNCSFRSYWEPTPTSNRRSPVNPMMPMPETLFARVEALAEGMKGVKGYYGDIFDLEPQDGVVYIDPPYSGTTFYGFDFDIMAFVNKCKCPCYVSEGKPLGENAIEFASKRDKGGICGYRKTYNGEWLTIFRP